MDILTIKEASLMWGISVRRITVLCNEGRIIGAKKIAGAWLLPKDAEKPADARVKSGKYTDWRNKSNLASKDFESNLKTDGYIITDNMYFHGYVSMPEEEIPSKNILGIVRKIKDYTYFLENHMIYKTTIYNVGDGVAVTERRG